ncbi:hypothetical protein EGW08_012531, partial [Elysia chlorotica]
CIDGFFGAKCSNHCSVFCLNEVCKSPNGECVACIEGLDGAFCDNRPDGGVPTRNYVSAVIVAGSLLVFLVLLTICIVSEINARKLSLEKSHASLVPPTKSIDGGSVVNPLNEDQDKPESKRKTSSDSSTGNSLSDDNMEEDPYDRTRRLTTGNLSFTSDA